MIFQIGKNQPHYGVYLLTGIVLWTYLAEATSGCVQCLVQREALLRKVRFPRMVIPLSVSLTSLFNLAMNSIAVLVFALANGITPRVQWLQLIPIVGALVVLATGLGMVLSVLLCPLPGHPADLGRVHPSLVLPLPGHVPGVEVRAARREVPRLRPDGPAHRDAQPGCGSAHPDGLRADRPASSTASAPRTTPAADGCVLLSLGIIVVIFGIGWWVFTREAPRVAENL